MTISSYVDPNKSPPCLFLRLVAVVIISVVSIAVLNSQVQVISFDWDESLIAGGAGENGETVAFLPSLRTVDNAMLAVGNEITIRGGGRNDSSRKANQRPSSTVPVTVDWKDSIFTRLHGEWDNDPIVLESHKLLFFSVPKVGCTNFKQLARRMMNYTDWATASPHNPQTNQLKYLGDYSKEDQERFMISPDWTRAIFLRDPKQRVLSAYMEKGLGTSRWDVSGAYIKRLCCKILPRETDEERRQEKQGLLHKAKMDRKASRRLMHQTCADTLTPYEKPTTSETYGFDTFVRRFMRQCDDPHWRPQVQRLSPHNWQFINFIGYLESVEEDARRLLERIGAYDEFGAHGWGRHNQSLFQSNLASHKTSSNDHTDVHYQSSELEGLVYQYYREDYEHPMMNFTKPANFEQVLLEMLEKEKTQQSLNVPKEI
jgi:hypothetical protein